MDNSLIEKYKTEMLEIYRKAGAERANLNAGKEKSDARSAKSGEAENFGRLKVAVTTLGSRYPLENACVTVFSGDDENRKIEARGFTDRSGKTDAFLLKTPPRSLSLTPAPDGKPYADYALEIKADGFADVIYSRVAVFGGVTTLKRAKLTP